MAVERGDAGIDRDTEGGVGVAVRKVVDGVDEIIAVGSGETGETAAGDFLLVHREAKGVGVVTLVAEDPAGDGAQRGVPKRQLGVVDERRAPTRGLVAVEPKGGRVDDEVLLETRIGNRRVGEGGVREDAVHIHENRAAIRADRALARLGLQPRRVADLRIVADEDSQVVAYAVGEFEVVGVKIGIVAVVGTAPIHPIGKDAEGSPETVEVEGIGVAVGQGRARVRSRRIAKCGGGGRLHVVKRAVDLEKDAGVAGSGQAAHADAVGLHAGEVGVAVGRIGGRAADVGHAHIGGAEGGNVVTRRAALVVQIDAGFSVLERLPTQGAGETAEIETAALAILFSLGVEGVDAQAEAGSELLVQVDRVALRAE